MKQTIRVIEIGTGKVVREIDVTGRGDRYIERLMAGLLKQMDTDKFCVDDSEAYAEERR